MSKKSRRKSKGFTLVERVVAIVVLSILVAIAMPKFIDLSKDVRKAAATVLIPNHP